ncbi:MAG: glycosyltransferase [Desulfobacteraceae bacterium]|nr:glycosyltransferase [Desulfobacteraceae bacterium]
MNKKIKILQAIYNLEYGGSERLAAFLSYSADQTKYEPSILGLFGSGPLTQELTNKGIPFCYFKKKRSPGRRIHLLFRIYKLLLKEKVDILQVHGSYPLTRVLVPALLSKVKVIYTEHAKQSLQTTPKLRLMTRFASFFCSGIVAVSYDLKNYLVYEVGINEKKIRVIHNGIDLNKFDPQKRTGDLQVLSHKKSNSGYVGVVGRLTEAKDHENLFKAWSKIDFKGIKAQLVIVGDGEKRDELKKLVNTLGIQKDVVFLGQREEIREIIASMDLMILPSKREGFPLSVLEYMAMGKSVIATKVGGVTEIIEHGVNGYLVPSENSEELAHAISNYFLYPEAFKKMAIQGQKTVIEKFNAKICLQAYEELYDEILHK